MNAMGDMKAQFEEVIHAVDGNQTFFDTSAFPWVPEVEARWKSIRLELDRLLSCVELLPGFEEIRAEQEGLTADRRWKIFPLYAIGQRLDGNERRCPETMLALKSIPGLQAAMFSVLQGKKEIPPHTGPYAGVLRYHLGLKIPKPETQCGINVGGDDAFWEEGKSLIFDDSHMHHAWNRSDEERVVLFVDFARPLPPQLAKTNAYMLSSFSKSDLMLDAAKRWTAWEAVHGAALDQHLAGHTALQA
jgi:beta-hydroxylase